MLIVLQSLQAVRAKGCWFGLRRKFMHAATVNQSKREPEQPSRKPNGKREKSLVVSAASFSDRSADRDRVGLPRPPSQRMSAQHTNLGQQITFFETNCMCSCVYAPSIYLFFLPLAGVSSGR